MCSISVLLTCHNRKAETLACLDLLLKNTLPDDYSLEIFLVDDGSTDGTSREVKIRYPQVHLINGNGDLYWNGGMHLAFSVAMERGFDYYLWLNDDTLLYPAALASLVEASHELEVKHGKSGIVVGSTQDATDGRFTYGGVVRSRKWKASTFSLVEPRDVLVKCDTMNGNCVLIPSEVARSVGNLEPKFAHAMGDLDYGLRAGYAGFAVWVMPGYAGTCAQNTVTGSFNDTSLPLTLRLRKMLHPKGLPLSSWRVFTQRHTGIFWPIFWLWPYAKVIINGLMRK